MGNVFSLTRARNSMEVVLEDLLCMARINPLTGLIVIAQFAPEDTRIGISGRYLSNTDALLAAIKKAEHKATWEKHNLR